MKYQQAQLITQFKHSCLEELASKQQNLQKLKISNIQRLEEESSALVNNLSKALIDLEDSMLRIFRENIKLMFDHQSAAIYREFKSLAESVEETVEAKKSQLLKMKQIVNQNLYGSKKILSKFAQGKFHEHYVGFEQELSQFQLQQRKYDHDEEDLSQLIQEIIELIYINTKRAISPPPKTQKQLLKSRLSEKNMMGNFSNLSYLSYKSKLKSSSVHQRQTSIKKNEEIREIQEELKETKSKSISQYGRSSAINQYKEQKEKKKKDKIGATQSGYKSEQSEITNLAKLVLAKQKLLKQLE